MRSWTAFALALMITATLAAQTPTPAPPASTGRKVPLVKLVEPAKQTSFMFVQTAESGTLIPIEGGGGKRYRLTLNRVAPETIYFSDRPQRIAGGVEMTKFLKSFPFPSDNPPNAAIVLTTPKSQDQDVIVAALTKPVYDANQRTLTYEVATLRQMPPGLAFYGEKRDERLPPSFEQVSLFIDDCPDMPAVCYGGYQCSGSGEDQQCCRVGCGSLPYNVGYCWHWIPPGCTPCSDYSDKCNSGPCDGSNPPYCLPNQCATDKQCS